MKNIRYLALVFVVLVLFFPACSKKQTVQPAERFDPEKSFASANELLEKKDYEKARASFLEVKNRDQTRKLAPLAQLKIADSYVKEGEPELAVTEYRKFLETYPDHQYAAFAQYQIAMVYFDQIESPERGYGGAAKALEEFEKLKRMYPRNQYREAVELKIEKCKNTIAEYEYLVGKFYYNKGSYQAALGRFEGLLKNFPGFQGAPDLYYYMGMSYKNLGDAERATDYLSKFIERYPSHKLVRDAQKGLKSLNRK